MKILRLQSEQIMTMREMSQQQTSFHAVPLHKWSFQLKQKHQTNNVDQVQKSQQLIKLLPLPTTRQRNRPKQQISKSI